MLTCFFACFRWIELVFNPRNAFEKKASEMIRFMHPYLAFATYRFHVEKAREIGKYSHYHFGDVAYVSTHVKPTK
jgi:hypothetical protein